MTPETTGRDLDRLIAEFRARAHALVAALPDPDVDDDIPGEVEVGGQRWWVHWHDPHFCCENDDGVVVEAHIYDPDLLDPWFLLQYAKTAGGHDAVVAACLGGFSDMVALLRGR
ncbi:hypothetical protein [Lentzea sp. NPDC060358]|uniref:hypothetical protein n=1 Tax=Lentzea sp. NPDC060358 TaxID=3347103 RepID=UPI003646D243